MLNCFPGVLITGSHCLLDSGVVDPRVDTCNFNSSRGCQDDHVRACPNWLKCFFFFFFLIFLIPHLLADRMNPTVQRNACPFYGFSGDMAEDFSRAWRCQDTSVQLVAGGLP